ncbi:23S rRNA (pseudouridine(1915)-N(3))-methyltransferase RlmH [Phragmitibacter flavus]|uniref:Ribosomal RNA large subunit methyltransferase H n=1 Tax=Phragmitibacter flavus TaxID=2576071 RepID=A0A5R8K807_9BACT|nr:23S rRNA (pseudouridine(1915)-N(3))-methyltransferase RlmH [Phragmitibacter flavus]TLD68484.1 23S rRNA (pseudouridine(1915)-N(3))-methyltransferase RlmH [Phragmitibacter flavus]
MKWQVITVGKPALTWAKAGLEDYARRLTRMAQVEMVVLKEGTPAQVAQRALEASKGSWRVVLDERGRDLTSVELSGWVQKQENASLKRVSVLIGGADGHDESLRSEADECWRLSKMTLQHEMALVLFYEQLYRAYGMLRGDPYHRA